MPNQHKTKLLGWHPSDPTLKPWVEDEAERLGVSVRELLDRALRDFRERTTKKETG
jgi:hypothetical protein